MKIIKKCIVVILVIISFSIKIYAKENNNSSLNISFVTENNSLCMDNVDVYIYKVGSYNSENFKFEWNEIFKKFEIDFDTVSDDDFISTINTIKDYVKNNNIDANYKLTTDSNGKANISFEDGIYFIYADEVEKNDVIYTPYPTLIVMPYIDEDGKSKNELSIGLKYDRRELQNTPTSEKTPTENTIITTQKPETPQNDVQTPTVFQSFIIRTGDTIPIISGIIILISSIIIIITLKRKNK